MTFRVTDRANRVAIWMAAAFGTGHEPRASERAAQSLDSRFTSLRDGAGVRVEFSDAGVVKVWADTMELAGDVLQDIADVLRLSDVESTAEFQGEFDSLCATLLKVEEFNATRVRLSADMADATQLVKSFVVKAEDARLLGDFALMRRMCGSLYDLNRELLGEYVKRANNHAELMAALKDVNAIIQRAARLRVGAPAAKVVQECRACIKEKNSAALFKVFRLGSA